MNKKTNMKSRSVGSLLFPLRTFMEMENAPALDSLEEAEIWSVSHSASRHNFIQRNTVRRSTFKKVCIVTESEISHCLLSVFDDAIDQIHIISGDKKSESTLEEFFQSLEERTANQFLYEPIFDKVTCDIYAVYFTKEKLRKVLADCSIVNEFLSLMKTEVKEENVLKCMRNITNNIIRRTQEEQDLIIDEQENFETLQNCKQLLETQHKETQKCIEEIKKKLCVTLDDTDVLLFENILREKYVNDWEKARREQNNVICTRAEDHLRKSINKCNAEIDTEVRVHVEQYNFLLEEEEDVQYNVKYWTEKLVIDTDRQTLDNKKLFETLGDTQEKYEEMMILYEKRARQIRYYLALRERRAREWEIKERRRIAATKIQAWWRGLMVRRKLGPFNPNKNKKGKKDKKHKKRKRRKKN